MRIMVTGGAGRLGQVVVRTLLARGHEVLPVDRRAGDSGGSGAFGGTSGGGALPATQVVDLCNAEALSPLMSGLDAVCHLGNLAGYGSVGEPVCYANNMTSNFNVFHTAFAAGVRRFVFASSIQAYGVAGHQRMCPAYLPLDEDHPLLARDAYSLSKSQGEELCNALVRADARTQAYSLRFTAIRHTPRPHPNLAKPHKSWVDPLPAGAWNLFTYIHIDDAAEAVARCCEVDRPGHTPLNVAAETPTRPWTWEQIEAIYGRRPPVKGEVTPATALMRTERMRQVLGFTAQRPCPSQASFL